MADVLLDEKEILNGRFFDLWINSSKKASVKTASAESSLQEEKVPIAGQLGNGSVITGADGSGILTFHDVIDSMLKDVNDCVRLGKPFYFDLISQNTNQNNSKYRRVKITNCKITKFKVIDTDIQKLLESSYDFTYNPSNVDVEIG